MTLNVQEAVLEPQDLVYTVLVIRLEDSKQDVFFSVSTSVLPSLLGAAPSQLQKIANRSIIMAPAARVLGKREEEEVDPECAPESRKCSAEVTQDRRGEQVQEEKTAAGEVDAETGKAKEENRRGEDSSSVEKPFRAAAGSAERDEEERNVSAPLPKEIWWLLVHIYSQISSEKERRRPRADRKTHDGSARTTSKRSGCSGLATSQDARPAKVEEKGEDEEPCTPSLSDAGRGDISSSSSLSMRRRCGIALDSGKSFDLASFLSSPCSAVLQRPKHLRGSTTFFRREGEGDHGEGHGEERAALGGTELNRRLSHEAEAETWPSSRERGEDREQAASRVSTAEDGPPGRRKEEEARKAAVLSREGAEVTQEKRPPPVDAATSVERVIVAKTTRIAEQVLRSRDEEEAARRKRERSLEEEAEFVRMCVESGVVVPGNVSVDAALMVGTKHIRIRLPLPFSSDSVDRAVRICTSKVLLYRAISVSTSCGVLSSSSAHQDRDPPPCSPYFVCTASVVPKYGAAESPQRGAGARRKQSV